MTPYLLRSTLLLADLLGDLLLVGHRLLVEPHALLGHRALLDAE